MIKQLSHLVEECPVCGRPVEIRCEYLGHRVVCQHCGGGFVVTEEGAQVPECRSSFVKSASDSGWPVVEQVTDEAPPLYREPAGDRESLADTDCPRILLVEHRDDVFARLAAEVAKLGFRVIRATTAWAALRCHAKQPFALVVANLNLPDQSGWLLAAKLHFVDPAAAVWLYAPVRSNMHAAMAKFLRVDELFAYGGDLLGLADAVAARLAERSERQPASYERPAGGAASCRGRTQRAQSPGGSAIDRFTGMAHERR